MTTKLRLSALTILILFCFVGYAQDRQVDSATFFDKENFIKDTLYIKTRFIECGEWGGHLELSKIYLKGDDFYLNFQKYKADCDKIKDNNGEPPQTLIQHVDKKLSSNDKLLVRNYIHKLVDAKFNEHQIGNFGYIFDLNNLDGQLKIHVYTWGDNTLNEYLTLIKNLLDK